MNLAWAYAEDFLIGIDNMGHKDHKNHWAPSGALEHFSGWRSDLTPLSPRAPKRDEINFLQTHINFIPLVSIFQDEQKSLWDPGSKMKSCSVSGGQSRRFIQLNFDFPVAMQGSSLYDVKWFWRKYDFVTWIHLFNRFCLLFRPRNHFS